MDNTSTALQARLEAVQAKQAEWQQEFDAVREDARQATRMQIQGQSTPPPDMATLSTMSPFQAKFNCAKLPSKEMNVTAILLSL